MIRLGVGRKARLGAAVLFLYIFCLTVGMPLLLVVAFGGEVEAMTVPGMGVKGAME